MPENNLCPFMSSREQECYCKTNCKFYDASNSHEPCEIRCSLETLELLNDIEMAVSN